jgi:hypothetical protein
MPPAPNITLAAVEIPHVNHFPLASPSNYRVLGYTMPCSGLSNVYFRMLCSARGPQRELFGRAVDHH